MPKGIYTRKPSSKIFLKSDPTDLFWAKVSIPSFDSCWEWTANKPKGRYGLLKINGRTYRAHRYSWEIHFGPIPDGLYVCHKCDNPGCVKPDHLFLGTQTDNMQDMKAKGRERKCVGSDHHLSKLTAGQVTEIRNLYSTGSYELGELGEMFGVSRTNVSLLVKRKIWKHVA